MIGRLCGRGRQAHKGSGVGNAVSHPVGKANELTCVFHTTIPVEQVQRMPGLARRLRAEPGRVRAERLRNRRDKPFPYMEG